MAKPTSRHRRQSKPAAAPSPPAGPAIATPRARRRRAEAFQAYVLVASAVFVTLALFAHSVAYFPVDLAITRAVQAYHGADFDTLMRAVSWLGFYPQVVPVSASVVLALFLLGLRWESVSALFAMLGDALGTLIKHLVLRPRPSATLVHVVQALASPGFPSGHVLGTTVLAGFVTFLLFTLLRPSALRTALLAGTLALLALMGLSRIYEGEHWFSDVMGAYLLGSLWLALTIRVYRWGKGRFFVRQPVAPPAPAGSGVA